MATPPKRWPTNAEWARMDAISQARQGKRRLLEDLDQVCDANLLRQMAKAIEAFNAIERILMAVGPSQSEKENHDG